MASTVPVAAQNDSRPSLLSPHSANLTDGELLERFVARHDEAAFELLLRRHGPMVLGVCQRTLHNEADTADAFQATFFVLVRKAASIRPRNMVGNWLYGVARNAALKARAMSIRRSAKELEAAARRKAHAEDVTWDDVQPVLDQELKALPDKYRSAVVLCDLEGKSLKDAAQQLGCPIGTVGTRVARGRAMLARRLARHGVAPSVGLLALLLSQNASSAAVPAHLADATTKAALEILLGSATAGAKISAKVAVLMSAALSALLLSRLKIGVAGLLVFTALTFAGAALAHVQAVNRANGEEKQRVDTDRLQGTWVLTYVQQAGVEVPIVSFKDFDEWTFDEDRLRIERLDNVCATYRIDATKEPKAIDFDATTVDASKGRLPIHGAGIYKFERCLLIICLPGPPAYSSVRPTEFASKGGEQWTSQLFFERKHSDKGQCRSR